MAWVVFCRGGMGMGWHGMGAAWVWHGMGAAWHGIHAMPWGHAKSINNAKNPKITPENPKITLTCSSMHPCHGVGPCQIHGGGMALFCVFFQIGMGAAWRFRRRHGQNPCHAHEFGMESMPCPTLHHIHLPQSLKDKIMNL